MNANKIKRPKLLKDYHKLSRYPFLNEYRKAIAETGGDPQNSLRIFLPQALWGWISSYVSHAFGFKHAFLEAKADPSGNQSYYNKLPDTVRLSIAGDWGSGTEESKLVAEQMLAWPAGIQADLTIHLGMFIMWGDEEELRENCLGGLQVANPRAKVNWPTGLRGSFALNGNHEMYALGKAYYDIFLPQLGWRDATGKLPGQGPSFFCLENKNWRIIGIDTGYNSDGLPIIGMIPWLAGDCHLEKPLLNWLETVVRPQENPKATILLSHHQYLSAFQGEQDYLKPAQQLAGFFSGQTLLWLWGHEHRFAGYQCAGTGNFKFHGRCIGHGGMPIAALAPSDKSPHAREVLFYDARINGQYLDDKLGFNGFARLLLDGANLAIEYYSLKNTPDNQGYDPSPDLLVTEKFVAQGANVVLQNVTRNYKGEQGDLLVVNSQTPVRGEGAS